MAASKKKIPKTNVDTSKFSKNARNKEIPESYLGKKPVWAFYRSDKNHDRWSLNCCDNFYNDIIEKLISFEGMTWQEIQSQSGGKNRGTNSHFIELNNCCKEARDRAAELNIYEDIFSLRLTGEKRIFGILQGGILYIIWIDHNHEIVQSNKKHT